MQGIWLDHGKAETLSNTSALNRQGSEVEQKSEMIYVVNFVPNLIAQDS